MTIDNNAKGLIPRINIKDHKSDMLKCLYYMEYLVNLAINSEGSRNQSTLVKISIQVQKNRNNEKSTNKQNESLSMVTYAYNVSSRYK